MTDPAVSIEPPDRLRADMIPQPGIVAVAWEMIRQVQNEAARLAMLRAEMEAQVDRVRVLLNQIERAMDADAETRRRQLGITAADMDAIR